MSYPTIVGLAILTMTSFAPQGARGTVQLEAADCSGTRMTFGEGQVAYGVRHERVPMSVGTLDVRPEANGGVRVEPGSGDTYAVTACVAAGGATADDAQRAVDAITLTIVGNKVRVSDTGQARNWSVQLIVEAPRGAQLDVETSNGPIGIRGVEGSITARAVNGPIGLTDVSASVRAVAVNGPISVSGSRGNIDVETQNGPISVDLEGSRWDGELNARAQNGPLTVRVPEGYGSALEVSSSRRSPWNCRIAECSGIARQTDENPRTLRIGSGTPTVRISTVNGPVTLDRPR
jgi:DUF4097 and DUF4098 domain-containing protein YvlB